MSVKYYFLLTKNSDNGRIIPNREQQTTFKLSSIAYNSQEQTRFLRNMCLLAYTYLFNEQKMLVMLCIECYS